MSSRSDRERQSLHRHLPSLDPLAAEVIRLRFGLGGSPPLSTFQAAERLSLTAADVYELHHQAIGQLRRLMAEPNPESRWLP